MIVTTTTLPSCRITWPKGYARTSALTLSRLNSSVVLGLPAMASSRSTVRPGTMALEYPSLEGGGLAQAAAAIAPAARTSKAKRRYAFTCILSGRTGKARLRPPWRAGTKANASRDDRRRQHLDIGIVVEHERLAGRHHGHRFVKMHAQAARRGEFGGCGNRRAAITADRAAARATIRKPLRPDKVGIGAVHDFPCEVCAPPDVYRVRVAIRPHDEPRSIAEPGNGQAFALADGIVHKSVMSSDFAPVKQEQRSGSGAFRKTSRDESAIVAVDETKIHRVRFLGDVQTEVARERTRFFFRALTQRQRERAQLIGAQTRQHVGLIF